MTAFIQRQVGRFLTGLKGLMPMLIIIGVVAAVMWLIAWTCMQTTWLGIGLGVVIVIAILAWSLGWMNDMERK